MKLVVLLFMLGLSVAANSQYGFHSPIDEDIKLAANFGELRDNHFHSGIDIRTDGKEGWNIYAVQDGYVSRILSSKKGYGNALYITHPNGLTSVYGHLQRYNEVIRKFESACQYLHEDFELDTMPEPEALPVKRGQLIAYSGNTGGSTGPHLHFEIRDTKTEYVLNPENYGFEIKDRISPKIYSVSLFAMNNYKSEFLQTVSLINGKTITVEPGNIAVGISGRDYYVDYEFNAGLYNTQLYANDTLVFEKRMDSFSFDNWRCINAHVDYGILKSKGYYIEKCFKDDGNLSEVYYNLVNNGILHIAPGEILDLKIVSKDHAGNIAELAFKLKGGISNKKPTSKFNVLPLERNELKAKKANLIIPPGAVYDTCMFAFYADTSYRKYSYKYIVGNKLLPIQKEIELKITPLFIPKKHTQKLYVRSLTSGSIGGTYDSGMMKARTRTCGTFVIDIDTMPPVIVPVNIPASKNISYNSTLKFSVYDGLTGIKRFKVTANGHYVLFRYDLKYNLISCNLAEEDLSGITDLVVMAEDNCGNIKYYKTRLYKK